MQSARLGVDSHTGHRADFNLNRQGSFLEKLAFSWLGLLWVAQITSYFIEKRWILTSILTGITTRWNENKHLSPSFKSLYFQHKKILMYIKTNTDIPDRRLLGMMGQQGVWSVEPLGSLFDNITMLIIEWWVEYTELSSSWKQMKETKSVNTFWTKDTLFFYLINERPPFNQQQ